MTCTPVPRHVCGDDGGGGVFVVWVGVCGCWCVRLLVCVHGGQQVVDVGCVIHNNTECVEYMHMCWYAPPWKHIQPSTRAHTHTHTHTSKHTMHWSFRPDLLPVASHVVHFILRVSDIFLDRKERGCARGKERGMCRQRKYREAHARVCIPHTITHDHQHSCHHAPTCFIPPPPTITPHPPPPSHTHTW